MAGRTEYETLIREAQNIVQGETGVKPARETFTKWLRKRGDRFFFTKTPQILKESIVGGQKAREN